MFCQGQHGLAFYHLNVNRLYFQALLVFKAQPNKLCSCVPGLPNKTNSSNITKYLLVCKGLL